jgi:hypothetical protein
MADAAVAGSDLVLDFDDEDDNTPVAISSPEPVAAVSGAPLVARNAGNVTPQAAPSLSAVVTAIDPPKPAAPATFSESVHLPIAPPSQPPAQEPAAAKAPVAEKPATPAPVFAPAPVNNELPFAPVADKPVIVPAASVPPAAPAPKPPSPPHFDGLAAVKEIMPLHVHIERALAELRDLPPAKTAAEPAPAENSSTQTPQQPPSAT